LLHADPHGGNLLVINQDEYNHDDGDDGRRKYLLGYVDFGLLSVVPPSVQEGLICAIAQLIFSRNVTAVAGLFGDLQLLPRHVIDDPAERAALAEELDRALSQVFVYDNTFEEDGQQQQQQQQQQKIKSLSTIPTLRFDKLLDVLSRLVPRFQFQLPPYFLNNARALSTLEGMAREADPSFNVLQSLYPYAINRLLVNPTSSEVVDRTLQSMVENPTTGRLDPQKLKKLFDDIVVLSGYSRRQVLRDILTTKNGSKLARRFVKEQVMDGTARATIRTRYFNKLANYLRL
jgi:predicted unusual protein kinase regulating ubiquinone biosynthesis (AarF/ABC1/UbiB family)